MEYNIKWNGRTIDNTGRHHLRWSAKRTRARRCLSCPGWVPGISLQQLPVCFTAVEISSFRVAFVEDNNDDAPMYRDSFRFENKIYLYLLYKFSQLDVQQIK